MDPLEQKITEVLKQIPFGTNGTSVYESDIVYSMEIDQSQAKVVLVIPEDYKDLEGDTARRIKEGLQSVDEIEKVMIEIARSREELESGEDASTKHMPPPQEENYLQEYENIILVASGKGGVGKSTVAINLALALKTIGKRVSLMDADVYGPSAPIMLGARNEPLTVEGKQVKPLTRFGLDFISVGNMVKEDQALIWRGPMAHQAIQQMLRDSAWPGGDYMIIDLPPGTGDVQLSLSQMTAATGAVIVCTPQDVALLDAKKAAGMFERVNVPVLGMIENMSSFVCPKCGAETPIFAKGGAERESKTLNVPFLGRIPIELDIRLGSDSGEPVVHAMPDSAAAKSFIEIAKTLEKVIQGE